MPQQGQPGFALTLGDQHLDRGSTVEQLRIPVLSHAVELADGATRPDQPPEKIDTIGMRGIGGVGELDLKLRYLVTLRDQVGAHAGFPAVFRAPVRAGSDEARLGDAGAIVGDPNSEKIELISKRVRGE